MKRILLVFFMLAGLLSSASQGWCHDEDQGVNAFGIRGGLSATHRDRYFHQWEVYVNYGLPWSVRADSGWGLAMQVNASLGILRAAQETGVIGGLGPGIIFDKAGGKGVAIELGGDLNGLSRHRFDNVDLNGNVLFDGHIGIMYRFDSGPGLGYRFQHMSNGGLNGKINTGLDLHMIELFWTVD